jgi:hypothetical protein
MTTGGVMKAILIRLMSVVILPVVLCGAPRAAETKPRIWLAPLDKQLTSNAIGSADYAQLFDEGDSWRDVLANVSVFKIYPYFLSRVPDDELRKIIQFLNRHHIDLALEARVLDHHSGCGDDGGEATLDLLGKVKRAGGSLSYLAMDEPLHHWRQRKKCNTTIDQFAKDVERKIVEIKRIFPNVRVGDVEPIGQWPSAAALMRDTTDWLDAFKRADGQNLAFIHADVGWDTSWLDITLSLRKEAAARGVRFGIIYNGNDLAKSDSEWSSEAVSHFKAFEDHAGRPDDVVFQSWVSHPSRSLPETADEALTGIARQYLKYKSMDPK